MISLAIDDFSCIRSARFQLAPVTVLIGPQGSGKSVTTKLLYFFLDLLLRQHQYAERGAELDEFKKDAARDFRIWFPPSAWGSGRFNINFSAGAFTARALRRIKRGQVTDDVAITFSDFFSTQYTELLQAYNENKSKNLDPDAGSIRRSLEGTWSIREKSEKTLSGILGKEYISNQTFIPAGRAFFTSIGRLVAAIEQGSSLDPVTIRFAKLFAQLRDRSSQGLRLRAKRSDDSSRRNIMSKLFGGEIRFERELEYIQADDGRRVPFSALSSGQQELMPMWILVDFFSGRVFDEEIGSDLFYIEEPEAHLFPVAQSILMDFLIGSLAGQRKRRHLILTTHSPYILSKLNNYIKAGQIAKNKRHASAVADIVPRECWLIADSVKAYAIDDGSMKSIISDDNLIDASYIDSISEDVSNVFSQLLDIQYPESFDK